MEKAFLYSTHSFLPPAIKVNSADVNEHLSILMDQEFNTIIEDGSLDVVSAMINWNQELEADRMCRGLPQI